MPQAPRIDPSAGLAPLPGVRVPTDAPAEAFGGGPGASAPFKIGEQALQEVRDRTFQEANDANVEDKWNKLVAAKNQALYDPQTGALARKGQNAFGIMDEYQPKFDKAAEDLSESLANETQRHMFAHMVRRESMDFQNTLSRHIYQQSQDFVKDTHASTIQTLQNQATLNFGDPAKIQGSLNLQDAKIRAFGQTQGWSKETTDGEVAKAKSDTHTSIIEKRLSVGAVDSARAYYNAHEGEILGKDSLKFPEYIDAYAKRLTALHDDAKKQEYDGTLRQAMLDSFSGKMTLTELQRLYRNDQMDNAGFSKMAHIVADPTFEFMQMGGKALTSDPGSFNAIREAQLSGEKTQREILDMINQGVADKKISTISSEKSGTPDSVYLTQLAQDIPKTPDEKATDAQAKNVRDFANRYYSDHENWFQSTFQGDKTKATNDQQAEGMVSDFLRRVDKEKATGDRIGEIAKEVQGESIKKDHPEISRLSDLPHIIVETNGKVRRVLNPDQATTLKGQYSITRNEAALKAPEKKVPKK